jgi:c-di-GMP-binding flagellar brake protein YcgR
VLRRKYFRQDYRFSAELESKVIDLRGVEMDAKAIDISMGGMGLIKNDPTDIGQTTTLKIALPNGTVCIDGNVTYNKVLRDGSRKLGIQFIDMSLEDRKRLVYYLFVILPRIQYRATTNLKNVQITLSDQPFPDDLFIIHPTLKPNRSEYQS